MIANIKCLISACNELEISFDLIHPDDDMLRIDLGRKYYFIHCATPLNRQDVARVCLDKDYTYKLLKNRLNMPETQSFLDPNYTEFKDQIKYDSVELIKNKIVEQFGFPVIVKMNSGSRKRNVYKCNNADEVKTALTNIYNKASKNYDYIALAQEMIRIYEEYRVVVLKGKIELVYKKYSFSAVDNNEFIKRLNEFIEPIYNDLELGFAGMDVALDVNNKLYLIEINSRPWFGPYIKKNGDRKIIDLYKKILDALQN